MDAIVFPCIQFPFPCPFHAKYCPINAHAYIVMALGVILYSLLLLKNPFQSRMGF